MKNGFLPALALLVALAMPSAASPYVNLAWDTCAGDGGASLRTFACSSNLETGADANVLVPSVVFDAPVAGFNGFDTVINIGTATPLPAWWGAGCAGKTRPWSSFSTTALCANDPYAGLGAGGAVPLTGMDLYPNSRAVAMRFAFGVPQGSEQDLAPGEYPTCHIVISNANTVGSAACAGCLTPACLYLKQVMYAQSGGNATFVTRGSYLGAAVAYWQSNVSTGGFSSCLAATPASNRTWGALKSLYR